MAGRAEWQATLRPRTWTTFVPPLVVGSLGQLALVSSSALGTAARGNPMWVMVPVYASIIFAIANTMIARRITYTRDGATLIVNRWWTRRSFSLVGARIACGKWTSALQGVVGTRLQVITADGTIELGGTGHVLADPARYTLPPGPAHVPALSRDDFVDLLTALDGPSSSSSPSAAPRPVDHTTIEITPSGTSQVLWWSFGSMLAAMAGAIGGAVAERLARTYALDPGATMAAPIVGALAALALAATVLIRFRGTPYRLEFIGAVVTVWRGTRVLVRDVPVRRLAITHGSHLVGRGGGTIATLIIHVPGGPTLRIGGSGVAPSAPGRSTWLFDPRLSVSALEWPALRRCLAPAEVRP